MEEAARLAARGSRDPGFWDRLVSQWKANKTVYNPPSTIRNFYQNFILRYLSGEDMTGVPQAALKLIRDPALRRRLMAEGRVAGDRASDIGETFLKKLDEKAVEVYSDADRLAAAIMSEATGKPPVRR